MAILKTGTTINGNIVWHAGNDGGGSGLDADSVDGIQGASMLRSDVNTTFSGGTFTIDSASLLRVFGQGDLSVSSTGHPFQVGPTTGGNIGMDGNEIMARSNGAFATLNLNINGGSVACGGSITAVGNIGAYYSDMRFKTKVGDIENPLDKVCSLTGFYYVENELAREFGYTNEEQQIALSAQEVQEVVPEAVGLAPVDMKEEDGVIVSKSGENYLTVDYAKLVPLLVEAIKEQQTQIDNLVKEVETLKGK